MLSRRTFLITGGVAAVGAQETGEQIDPDKELVALGMSLTAFEIRGQRQNIGVKYGLLHAQLALALDGVDRENVLRDLLEALARRTASSGR